MRELCSLRGRNRQMLMLLAAVLIGCGVLAPYVAPRVVRRVHRIVSPPPSVVATRDVQSVVRDPAGRLPEARPIQTRSDDWTAWRGPLGNNHAPPGVSPPWNWSESANLRWKTTIAGRGHSSPIVLDESLYVTTADDAAQTQSVLSLERATGEINWTTTVHRGEFIHSNVKSSHASSTPATDGEFIFVLFAGRERIWLSALTLGGDAAWTTEVGPYASKEGFGASPLLSGPYVIVAADSVGKSWIAAVHRGSGELVWRTLRGPGTSYASPILIPTAQEPQVVIAGLDRVTAYSVDRGVEIWRMPGPDLSASTPTYGGGVLFVTGCTADSGISGIALDGTKSSPIWNHRIKVEVPSPLYHDGLAYFVQDSGVMVCVDGMTGEIVWRKRLGSNVTSSPVLVGDRLLLSLEDGRTLVLRTGREFEILFENSLDDSFYATPVVSRGQIFLRGLAALYCIEQGAAGAEGLE